MHLLVLPLELLLEIFYRIPFQDGIQLALAHRRLYKALTTPTSRANWLLYHFGQAFALGHEATHHPYFSHHVAVQLLERGADPLVDRLALANVCIQRRWIDILDRLLCEYPIDIDAYDGCLLRTAVATDNEQLVKHLIDRYQANIHVQHEAPLRMAIWRNHDRMVALLLEHGACVDVQYHLPLRCAALDGNAMMVRLLLEHGADADAMAGAALTSAAQHGHLEVVKVLLGVGRATVDIHHGAPLWQAVRHAHTEVVACLLAHGASPDLRYGRALRDAARRGLVDITRLLLDHGARACVVNGIALQLAAQRGHVEVCRLLLAHGANIHAHDEAPLRAAIDSGDEATVALMLAHGAKANHPSVTRLCRRRGFARIARLMGVEYPEASLAI